MTWGWLRRGARGGERGARLRRRPRYHVSPVPSAVPGHAAEEHAMVSDERCRLPPRRAGAMWKLLAVVLVALVACGSEPAAEIAPRAPGDAGPQDEEGPIGPQDEPGERGPEGPAGPAADIAALQECVTALVFLAGVHGHAQSQPGGSALGIEPRVVEPELTFLPPGISPLVGALFPTEADESPLDILDGCSTLIDDERMRELQGLLP